MDSVCERMHVKCGKCGEVIRQKQQKLTCHECEIVCHRTCTGLMQDEYRSMVREKTLDSWLCDVCAIDISAVSSPDGVRNVVTMSGVVSSVDGALDQMQNTVCKETLLQNASTSPGSVENRCQVTKVHGTTTQNTSALSTVPASEVQNTLAESNGVQRVFSTLGSAQNVVLTASLQNVMSASTQVQSAVSISSMKDSFSTTSVLGSVSTSGVTSSLSTAGGVLNAVSTSDVTSSLSTAGGVLNAVSTSGVTSSLSTAGGVLNAVSTSGVPSTSSTSGGIQSAMSTSGVPSSLSTAGGVQNAVSTSGVPSTSSTSGGVQSAMSTSACNQNVHLTSAPMHSVLPPLVGAQNVVAIGSVSLRGKDSFTSAVQSVINRIHNVLSKTQSVRQNTTQCQMQRVGIDDDTLQKQPAPSEQQNIVQKSCNKEFGTEKGVSEIQYSCCGVHGKVKPKTQDVLQQELSPFEEKIGDDLNGPRILIVALRPATDTFEFELRKDQLEMVTRSINSKKNNIQARLRFCPFSSKSVQENIRPEIKVNHRKVNNNLLQNKVDLVSTSMQKVETVDITDELRKDLSANVVDIRYQSKNNYYLTCELVKKNSVADLLELMTVNHPEHTEDLIRQKFKGDDDCEISTTNLRASLICPIGKMRLLKPCRSKHCTHIQCIDASTVLSLNQSNPKWKCQICQKPAKFDDLYIDGLFLKILASVPWDVVEVEFLKDGSWMHKKSSSQMSNGNDEDKENFCNLLDETIEKLDVIDLTETDDECSPVKRTPLKTNTALANRIVKTGPQRNAHFKRLGSGGSTCSESSFRTGSSSSTSSVSSSNSTSNYSSLSSCSNRSTAIASTYNNDHSSYGSHKRSKRVYRPKGPYQTSRNYNRHFSGYGNLYPSGQFCQTTIDQYTNSWRNVNRNVGNYYSSVNTGSNSSNYYNSFW